MHADVLVSSTAASLRRLGKRREIGRKEIMPGGQHIAGRLLPAVLAQDRLRALVDVETPGREEAHMAPSAHIDRAARVGSFIEFHGDAARDQMGGGGEPDGTGTDDGDREV